MFTDEVIQKAVTNRIKPLFDYPVLTGLCNVERESPSLSPSSSSSDPEPPTPEPPPPHIRISKTKPLELKFLIPF
jgi:hypothetical protein